MGRNGCLPDLGGSGGWLDDAASAVAVPVARWLRGSRWLDRAARGTGAHWWLWLAGAAWWWSWLAGWDNWGRAGWGWGDRASRCDAGGCGLAALGVGDRLGDWDVVALVADWWWRWLNWLLRDRDSLSDSDNRAGRYWWGWWWWRNICWMALTSDGLSAGGDDRCWDILVCQPGRVVRGTTMGRDRRAAWDELGDGLRDCGWVDGRDGGGSRGRGIWWWHWLGARRLRAAGGWLGAMDVAGAGWCPGRALGDAGG